METMIDIIDVSKSYGKAHRNINTYVIHSVVDMHVFELTDGNQMFPERNFDRKESGIRGELNERNGN